MKIQNQFTQPVMLRQPAKQQAPASAPVDKFQPTPPPETPQRSAFAEAVAESIEDCSHQGKKLGTLALVSYATAALPIVALTSAVNVIPDALFGPVGIATMVGTLALASLEEKHIGIGKQIGRAAGAVVGAGVGVVRGASHEIFGRQELPARAEIKQQLPGQAKPFRPLLQAGLDATLGPVQKRTKAVELGELIGATASTLITAYTVPAMIGNSTLR